MKFSIILVAFLLFGCQSKNKDSNESKEVNKVSSTKTELGKNISVEDDSKKIKQENIKCDQSVCLELRNHDIADKSFDIYMFNSIQVAGFQCDFPGIKIKNSAGGLLEDNGYQTSNSDSRILSFSMQAKLIPLGEGKLTTVYYSDSGEEVCMTKIIFAGSGGEQLSTNNPNCLKLY